ncbi:hypothetical protein M422DRAFT_269421 [Sphaerobolus stellatus SS14]|uniref:F-box domain-containing protein n=1 Tax=Sphaerobolus stellatus (strain SS14) TaxID=990650 RepID=A0A0C9UVK7_SPHS4|nr:hypothetical protein M422DRAFT_269421 [Sphaerobolus stellatus SS14]
MPLPPPEILDLISSFIDIPSELLSLASTCKILYDVIVPYHLQYRYIRCDAVRRPELWHTFSCKPHLAARIRCLELVEVGTRREASSVLLPKTLLISREEGNPSQFGLGDLRNVDFVSSMQNLLQVLPLMSNLRRFCWSIRRSSDCSQQLSIFEAVQYCCKQLEDFQIVIEKGNQRQPPQRLDLSGIKVRSLIY